MILIQNVDTTKSVELPTGARFQNRLRRISYEKKCEPGDPKPL